jgi:hypothetical protein
MFFLLTEKEKVEQWGRANTYTNNWESPTAMISFEDKSLRGLFISSNIFDMAPNEHSHEGGLDVKQKIWDGVQPVIEEWIGRKIYPTSLYGIRIYKSGSILATRKYCLTASLAPHCVSTELDSMDEPKSGLLFLDVDRLPLVSSCIIHVADDVDEVRGKRITTNETLS